MFETINLSCYADSEIDSLVSGPGRPLESTPVFLEFVQQAKGPVLELGSGLGRYTIPLAERGIDMTGVELSAPSLAFARQQAGDLPIRWVEADARDFHLDQRFHRIFARGCVFDFMLTRQDQEAMLACVREHLADDGQYLFDVCERPPNEMVNESEEVAWFTKTHPNGREIHFSGKSEWDYAKQYWIQTGYERWDAPTGELVRPPWELTLRYTMPQDLETLLHYNGFKVVATYAEHDGTPATEGRLPGVYICEKR
ncbi:MAG: class I SAM-dependent methyltransferase [Chloroflexota bacterium]